MSQPNLFYRKVIGTILIIILTALLISVQAFEGNISEPFNDPELPGWERSENALVVDGVLRINRDGFALHPGEWNDQRINVRAKLEGEGVVAVSYKISELGEYAIHINNHEITFIKAGEPIAQEMLDSLQTEEWFSIEVFSIGEHNEVLLNGEIALVAFDPEPLPGGGVALSVLGDAIGAFDDFSVFPMDEVPPEEPEGEDPDETEEIVPMVDVGEQLSASELSWVRTGGPPGGIGYDIRYKFDDSTTWYVTDNYAGVHISTDNGLTWQPSNQGIPG